jgi:cytochrome c5
VAESARKTPSSTSRKPRSGARAASRPATSRRPVEEQEADDIEVSAADAQEAEAEGHYITATLCGEEVQVIPPTGWRASWNRLLNQGQMDEFARLVFHPDDYELYLELDPTMLEWAEFTEEASRIAGESLGNSRGPAPSSRRTRRR